MPGSNSGGWVEALTWESGGLLNGEANEEKAWEAVGEVQGEKSTHEAHDTVQIGYGRSNDESKDPIHGTQEEPAPLALLRGNRREVENLLEDFEVDGLHANVEVEDWSSHISDVAKKKNGNVDNLQIAMNPVSNPKTLFAVCRLYGVIICPIFEAEYCP